MTKEFHGRCNKIEHVAEKHSLAETRGDPVASPRRKTTSELRQLKKASGRSSCSLTTDTLLGPLGSSKTASSRGCLPTHPVCCLSQGKCSSACWGLSHPPGRSLFPGYSNAWHFLWAPTIQHGLLLYLLRFTGKMMKSTGVEPCGTSVKLSSVKSGRLLRFLCYTSYQESVLILWMNQCYWPLQVQMQDQCLLSPSVQEQWVKLWSSSSDLKTNPSSPQTILTFHGEHLTFNFFWWNIYIYTHTHT